MRNLFSYKNLSSYGKLYDFNGSSVISLIDSGDDYLVSLLNSCGRVELFDKEYDSYNYLLFKIEAIKNLNYDEFFKYFIFGLKDKYLEDKILMNSSIKQINVPNPKVRKDLRYDSGDFIPYFDKKLYYKLQFILRNLNYPLFHKCNIWKLHECLSGSYDILLTSCVFDDIYQKGKIRGIKNYKKLLDSFEINQIQAYYYHGFMSDDVEIEFLNRGLDIDFVDSIKERDSVISLIKK